MNYSEQLASRFTKKDSLVRAVFEKPLPKFEDMADRMDRLLVMLKTLSASSPETYHCRFDADGYYVLANDAVLGCFENQLYLEHFVFGLCAGMMRRDEQEHLSFLRPALSEMPELPKNRADEYWKKIDSTGRSSQQAPAAPTAIYVDKRQLLETARKKAQHHLNYHINTWHKGHGHYRITVVGKNNVIISDREHVSVEAAIDYLHELVTPTTPRHEFACIFRVMSRSLQELQRKHGILLHYAVLPSDDAGHGTLTGIIHHHNIFHQDAVAVVKGLITALDGRA